MEKLTVSETDSPRIEKMDTTPVCPHESITSTRGYMVCVDCGNVLQSESGINIRVYSKEAPFIHWDAENPPIQHARQLFNMGLARTVFQPNELDSQNKHYYYRLRRHQTQATSSKSRIFFHAAQRFRTLAEDLGANIPQTIIDETYSIFRKAINRDVLWYKNPEERLIAAFYVVVRQRGVPITLKTIGRKLNIKIGRLMRTARAICDCLSIKLPAINLDRFAQSILSQLGADIILEKQVYYYLSVLKPLNISGRDPNGIVGALIYVASINTDRRYTQRHIAKITRVTEITIRNQIKYFKVLGIFKNV